MLIMGLVEIRLRAVVLLALWGDNYHTSAGAKNNILHGYWFYLQ